MWRWKFARPRWTWGQKLLSLRNAKDSKPWPALASTASGKCQTRLWQPGVWLLPISYSKKLYTRKATLEKKTSQWKPNWKGFACDVCLAVRRRLAACLWPMVKIIECVRLPWQSVLSQAGSFFSKKIRNHGKCVAMCSIYGDNRRSTAGVLQFVCTITTTTILCLQWHSMVGPVASVHCPLFVIAKRAARHKSVTVACQPLATVTVTVDTLPHSSCSSD